MNIGIGKIGQKILFDREGKEAKRSNNNGNFDVYKFCSILFDNFEDDRFFLVGDSDYGHCEKRWGNVLDVSQVQEEYYKSVDVLFAYGGLPSDDDKVLRFVRESKCDWAIFSTDSRCLCDDIRVFKDPVGIYSMGSRQVCINDRSIESTYLGLEKCIAYKHRSETYKKDVKCIVSTSESKEYDRVGSILKVIGKTDVPVYGRCPSYVEDGRFKGEIQIREMHCLYSRAKTSLCSPIDRGWVTGKYMECLMFDVIPLFTFDYGCDIIIKDDSLVSMLKVSDEASFASMVERIDKDDTFRVGLLERIKKSVGYDDAVSGKAVCESIRRLKDGVL